MPNLKLTQTALSLLGRKLREYKEAGLDQKGNCETWWKECERFYRNEAPEAPSERLVPFHVPFSQPRQDALTAQACTVIGKQEPYMLATNVGDSSRQDRLQRFVHTLWQAANFELQIRKASTIASNINAAFYRLTPKKPGSEASGSQMAANVTERPGIQIDVIHGSDMSVFPASLGGIERAVYVGHRFYPRVKDVKNLQEQGVYYKNARVQGGQSPDEYDETGAFEQAKTYLSDYGGDQDQSQTELWNGCVRLDLSWFDSKQEKGEKWYLATFADATQEVLSLEPYDYSRPWYFLWTTGLQAGKAGMKSDGTQFFDALASNIAGADPWTIFVVATPNDATNYYPIMGGDFGSIEFRFNNTGKADCLRNSAEDLGSGTTGASVTAPSLNVATFDHTLGSNQTVFRINALPNGSGTGHTTASGGSITLGFEEAPSGFIFKGTLFELIMYHRVLSASEISYVENAESVKWKLGF